MRVACSAQLLFLLCFILSFFFIIRYKLWTYLLPNFFHSNLKMLRSAWNRAFFFRFFKYFILKKKKNCFSLRNLVNCLSLTFVQRFNKSRHSYLQLSENRISITLILLIHNHSLNSLLASFSVGLIDLSWRKITKTCRQCCQIGQFFR